MLTLIFAEIIFGFKRIWKLYLTNIISILFIIMLFAYIDGSMRQLNLQKTAFSGEIVVKMNTEEKDIEKILKNDISNVLYVSKKIRTLVRYRLPHNKNTGYAELIGVDLESEKNLKDYLTLKEGRFLSEKKDILVPTSIWQKMEIKLGDVILVMGKNANQAFNVGPFKVCGFYHSPGLTLFELSSFLVQYEAMQNFYMPKTRDIEYCVYFINSDIPGTVNKEIRAALNDLDRTKVRSINTVQLSIYNVMNISVQMGVFLVLLITLTIIVVVTIVMLVNFNIYMILFRKRQKQLGTLMTFGITTWKIGLTLFLESFFQIIISTIIAVIFAYVLSILARQQMAGGFLEAIFVLLSGTNRIDFFIRINQIITAFCVIITAVVVAQIPIFIKIFISNPIEVLSGREGNI